MRCFPFIMSMESVSPFFTSNWKGNSFPSMESTPRQSPVFRVCPQLKRVKHNINTAYRILFFLQYIHCGRSGQMEVTRQRGQAAYWVQKKLRQTCCAYFKNYYLWAVHQNLITILYEKD